MDQVCPKRVFFRSKTEKVNTTTEFYMLKLARVLNLSLNWQFWFLGISSQKTEKVNITIEFCMFELFKVLNFNLDRNFFFFLDQIRSKREFLVESRKSEHHHWTLHVRISHGTNFQLKLTILIFRTKFAQKEYFSGLKQRKWTPSLNSACSN